MSKTKKRGGAKAHRKRVKKRNDMAKAIRKKTEKLYTEAMEKLMSSLSGATESSESVENSEVGEQGVVNLGLPNIEPHL